MEAMGIHLTRITPENLVWNMKTIQTLLFYWLVFLGIYSQTWKKINLFFTYTRFEPKKVHKSQ